MNCPFIRGSILKTDGNSELLNIGKNEKNIGKSMSASDGDAKPDFDAE